MNDIILQTEQLCYRYPDGTPALNGVTLSVRKGERLAVMGSNGSGKSTLFLCLNGVLRPSSGLLRMNGQPADYSRKGLLSLRRKVGIVFQDPDTQLFSADVYGEISFGPLNLGLPENEVQRRVEQTIDTLNITEFQDKPVHLLSGGQKKRVAIADILVMHPDVIIFDEPTAALDPKHTQLVNEEINRLSSQGITVITATHDAGQALAWADSVLVLDAGHVLAKDTPLRIFSDQTLLIKAGLEQPYVLRLFSMLCEKGILSPELEPPRTEAELEKLLAAVSSAK